MTETINKTGLRLKQARIQAGYHTAKEFYEKFQLTPSTYTAHESGRNPLNQKTAKRYAELLDVSDSWLLAGVEHEEINKYVLHYGEVPRDNLLNKMLNETTIQYLKAAGIQKGMHVAEFACGTGAMSCWLAEFVGDNGKVYAIDKGYEQTSLTERRASALNIKNIEIIRTEINSRAAPINKPVDLIYMRCFLHHLKNPTGVLKMAIDLLPENGIIVCMEPILSSFFAYPEIAETQKAIDLYIKLGEGLGLDFNIGHKLYHHLYSTNKLTDFKAFIYHGIGVSKLEKSWLEMITSECASRYIEKNLATEDEMDSIISKIRDHISQENSIQTLPEFVCISSRKK